MKVPHRNMKRWALRAGAGLAFAVVTGVGLALAAPPPVEPPKMSTNEQAKKAESQLGGMKAMLQASFDALQRARAEQDINKLNCVNESLSAIKGLMRLSEQNYVALQEAIAKKDDKGVEHEYVKISIAYNKIAELEGRVKSCGGPATTGDVDGKPTIDRIVDADIPTEDPGENVIEVPIDNVRPPSASPFF